jgi:hypothetical protein
MRGGESINEIEAGTGLLEMRSRTGLSGDRHPGGWAGRVRTANAYSAMFDSAGQADLACAPPLNHERSITPPIADKTTRHTAP